MLINIKNIKKDMKRNEEKPCTKSYTGAPNSILVNIGVKIKGIAVENKVAI